MLKQGRNTEKNKSYNTAWTNKWIPTFIKVDLESNT